MRSANAPERWRASDDGSSCGAIDIAADCSADFGVRGVSS
jgi:hypothetical protein